VSARSEVFRVLHESSGCACDGTVGWAADSPPHRKHIEHYNKLTDAVMALVPDRAAVDAALRQVIAHADYDLLKSLEGDESGVDEFPEYVDRFIAEYGKAVES